MLFINVGWLSSDDLAPVSFEEDHTDHGIGEITGGIIIRLQHTSFISHTYVLVSHRFLVVHVKY